MKQHGSVAANRKAVTFHDELNAVNSTFHSSELVSAIMPPLPGHVRLPALAKVWVGLRSQRAIMRKLYEAKGSNFFVYLAKDTWQQRGVW